MTSRRCEQCGSAIPDRMARQRNDKGQLICGSCKGLNMPSWSTSHSSLNVVAQSEMRKREAEAIVSISKWARMQREATEAEKHGSDFTRFLRGAWPRCRCGYDPHDNKKLNEHFAEHGFKEVDEGGQIVRHPITGMFRLAHDSGDNAIINHCPFCGSGAVTGGSDGSVECDFCHNNFTVQVQPAHPNMPQTIDGVPTTPPGMPGGEETEVSGPEDPAVQEDEDGVATNPLDDAAATPSNGPVSPGQVPSKQPQAPTKADPKTNPGKGADQPGGGDQKGEDGKKKNLPPWLKKKQIRTHTGAVLPAEEYMAHLALAEAGPYRLSVLEAVRLGHMVRQATNKVECPRCDGQGEIETGKREHDTNAPVTRTCPRCHGSGELDADNPENFDLREPPHEGSMRPFSGAADQEPNSKGLYRHEVNAEDIKSGDFLDIGGKVRAHRDALVRGDRVTVGWKLRGSGAPGVRQHQVGEKVKVWRRQP